jgi:transposase
MPKPYKPYNPDQTFLLPPDMHEWLEEGHLAYFVDETVDTFDLSEIYSYYEQCNRGNPPYNPTMMTKLILYSYCIGMPSSRKINKATIERIDFRVLTANNQPDFRTISDFRKIHLEALKGLFNQVIQLCKEAGLVKLGTVALDGTKVKANASKDKNRTYEKLAEEEMKIQKIVDRMFEIAEKVDEEEDRLYGKDKRGDELPEGFRTRKERLERIQKAKKDLEEKRKEKQEAFEAKIAEREIIEEQTGKKIRGRKPKIEEVKKVNEKERNTTDPDSRFMKSRDGYVQGYNGQLVVDCESQVIIAADVTQDCNDLHQLVPMIEQVEENTGQLPKNGTMDSGYWCEEQITEIEGKLELYIATTKDWKERKRLREQPAPRGRIPKNFTMKERMERKLLTKRGKKVYAKRGCSVEPVNGQIKEGRGFRQFLLRGLKKVKGEWGLMCIGHNVLKLWQARKKQSNMC